MTGPLLQITPSGYCMGGNPTQAPLGCEARLPISLKLDFFSFDLNLVALGYHWGGKDGQGQTELTLPDPSRYNLGWKKLEFGKFQGGMQFGPIYVAAGNMVPMDHFGGLPGGSLNRGLRLFSEQETSPTLGLVTSVATALAVGLDFDDLGSDKGFVHLRGYASAAQKTPMNDFEHDWVRGIELFDNPLSLDTRDRTWALGVEAGSAGSRPWAVSLMMIQRKNRWVEHLSLPPMNEAEASEGATPPPSSRTHQDIHSLTRIMASVRATERLSLAAQLAARISSKYPWNKPNAMSWGALASYKAFAGESVDVDVSVSYMHALYLNGLVIRDLASVMASPGDSPDGPGSDGEQHDFDGMVSEGPPVHSGDRHAWALGLGLQVGTPERESKLGFFWELGARLRWLGDHEPIFGEPEDPDRPLPHELVPVRWSGLSFAERLDPLFWLKAGWRFEFEGKRK